MRVFDDVGVPGLALDRFRDFFEAARPGAVAGPLRARVIDGGRSNLTYEVTDGRSSWIVRRPPLGHVLATAHDMAREYRVMTALAARRSPSRRRTRSATTPPSSARPST